MKVVDYIADSAKEAAEQAFRYAEAVPTEKLDWEPVEGVRSTLNIVRELAMTPTWAYDLLFGDSQTSGEGDMEAQMALMASWSLDEAKKQFAERFAKFETSVRAMSEERFTETKWLPYDGGRDFTVLEMLDYPRWNFNYHQGQIAYIQMLYGDKDMH